MAIQLPPNSTGTVVDTNTVAAKDREIVNIGDPSAANTAAVTNAAAAAAAQGLVVRNTPRRGLDPALTVTNLGISGNFTSAWFSGGDGGEIFVEVAARADVASGTDGFKIEESDSTGDANFTRTVAQVTVSANTTTYLRVRVRAGNWRVNYTNGGTAQTAFRVAYATAPAGHGESFEDFHTGASILPVEIFGIALPGASGPVVGGTATNPLRTDTTGTTTQPISAASLPLPTGAATAANQLPAGHTVDPTDRAGRLVGQVEGRAASGAAKAGNPNQVGGVFNTTQPTVTTGQAVEAQFSARGEMLIAKGVSGLSIDNTGFNVTGSLPAGANNIGDVDVLTMPTGASAAQVQGDVANDGVDSGNPVKVGGLASGAVPTAVAAADRVNAYHDREGRQIMRPWGAGDWTQVHTPAANTQATTSKAAGAAGIRHVCTGITATFAAGATAPTAVQLTVALRDGASGAGTIVWQATLALPATAGAMAGVTRSGLFIRGTAATAMTLEFSAAGGANTFESVSMEGVDITEA